MTKFKVGDKVKINGKSVMSGSDWEDNYDNNIGYVTKIIGRGNGIDTFNCIVVDNKPNTNDGYYFASQDLELISLTKKNMNIKEKFVLAITPEPQKSFRKAGITNGDDLLTEDGMNIFLSWLLKKNQDDFKEKVVDGLLEDED